MLALTSSRGQQTTPPDLNTVFHRFWSILCSFCLFVFFNNSTFSCSSAASVFSLREVQLQKDPGHRSSVFQPLGKNPLVSGRGKKIADYKTHF